MSRSQTAEEMRQQNTQKMGSELGAQYSELWQRVVRIHIYWGEYTELFGSKDSRIALLNRAAPQFFHMLQDELWDAALLHIARLTDKPAVRGQKNLTIRNLPMLIQEEPLRTVVAALVEAAVEKTEFCRTWRNLRIAHDDLLGAIKDSKARALEGGSRAQVKEALQAIASVMNAVHMHYLDSEMLFKPPGFRPKGAVALLYVMDDGLRRQEEFEERRRSGKLKASDFEHRDL